MGKITKEKLFMSNSTIFTKEQKMELIEALKGQKNIAIIGQQGTGKTTVYKELLGMISKADTSSDGYSALDEIADEIGQKNVNLMLEAGHKVIFTHHSKNVVNLTKLFPQFTGYIVRTSRDNGEYHVAVEQTS